MKTSADDLKDIIAEHQGWQSFGWKVPLVCWSLILLAVAFWDWLVPAWTWAGLFFYALGFLVQIVIDLGSKVKSALAVRIFWTLGIGLQIGAGIVLPAAGLLSPLAGAVIQNFFLAITVFLLGTHKGRVALEAGALAPAAAAIFCGIFPQAQGLFPLAVLAGVVVPAVFLKTDR